ncbi:MAG: Peptidyl-prolyl cis-trans isomerase (rotamase) - cyclophilin family [Verrucomicrobia bacterium]|nr:MAG: Peptidyl-prolyl cis-trans isomerase (rotamase) - cyclophilin family [Verrucomicrobiota bacterium]
MNVPRIAFPGSLSAIALTFALVSLTAAEPKPGSAPKPQPDRVSLDFVVGDRVRRVVLELDAAAAPQTVANFKKLVQEGFYDGLAVHRAINHYLVQMGDPLTKDNDAKGNWGTGSPGYTVPAEIKLKHQRGAVAMARLPDGRNPSRASNGSQFYIALADMSQLDGQYTVFGSVVSGIEHLDFISEQTTDTNDMPVQRIKMSAQIGEGEAKSAPVEVLAQGAETLTKGATSLTKGAGSLTKGAVSAASQGVRAAGAAVKDVDKVIPKIDLPKVPFIGAKSTEPAPRQGGEATSMPPAAQPEEVILEEVPAGEEPKEKRLKLPSLPKFRKPDGSAFRDPVPSAELIPTSATAALPPSPNPVLPAPSAVAMPAPAPAPAEVTPPIVSGDVPTQGASAPTDAKAPKEKRFLGKVITRFW